MMRRCAESYSTNAQELAEGAVKANGRALARGCGRYAVLRRASKRADALVG